MAHKTPRSILIKGGRIVSEDGVFFDDLYIKDGLITEAESVASDDIDEVVDASGLLVLPGGVDTHIHLNDVFMNTVSVHDLSLIHI